MQKSLFVFLVIIFSSCSNNSDSNLIENNELKVPIAISIDGGEISNYNYNTDGKLISIDIDGIILADYQYNGDLLNSIREYSGDGTQVIRTINYSYSTENRISEIQFTNAQNQVFSRKEFDYMNGFLVEVRTYSTFNFVDFNLSSTEALEYQNNNLFKKTVQSNSIPNDIYIVYQYDDKKNVFFNVPEIKFRNYANNIYHFNTNNIVSESSFYLDTDELLFVDNFNYSYDSDDFPTESTKSNLDGSQPTKLYLYNQ